MPRYWRGVGNVGHAFAADRPDRKIDVVESEAVRGEEFRRVALRGKLHSASSHALWL